MTGKSSNTNCDQDSDISFMNDTDEEIDNVDIEEEDWIEHFKRSTEEAIDQMKTARIQCWIKTHRRMRWRLATRMTSLPEEKWIVKAAEWNPELSTKNRTYRSIGGPRRRWEDEINEFHMSENVEDNAWIEAAQNRERYRIMEKDFAKTAAERSTDNAARRGNFAQDRSRPGRIGRQRTSQQHHTDLQKSNTKRGNKI